VTYDTQFRQDAVKDQGLSLRTNCLGSLSFALRQINGLPVLASTHSPCSLPKILRDAGTDAVLSVFVLLDYAASEKETTNLNLNNVVCGRLTIWGVVASRRFPPTSVDTRSDDENLAKVCIRRGEER
jgi:hypothetical protein